MSLTNPNTVVTEQRLNDFYKGILPYLGGMPEMVANKFSKSDIYSTSEKMIGQWTDGKPLYQRVFSGSFPSTTTGTYASASIGTITNLDKVVSTEGFYYINNTWVSMPWTSGSGYMSKAKVTQSGTTGTVTLETNNSSSAGVTGYVVVQYTKTTDSSVSIGEETEYSTSEKIVGSWINGKPIYQKTITGYNLPSDIVDDTYKGVNIPYPSGIDRVISLDGTIKNPSGIQVCSINGVVTNAGKGYPISAFAASSNIIVSANKASLSGFEIVLTIQYTKA